MFRKFMTAAALSSASFAAGAAGQASLYGDPAQLFTVAGFRIVVGKPVNACGAAANPRVTLLDFSGDRQKNEALFVDTGPCYAPDNAWFALAARDAPGRPWRLLFKHTGTVKALASTTQGWLDMEYASGGKTVPIRYFGGVYAPVASASPSLAAPARGGALLSPATRPQALTPAQRAALYQAAGAQRKGGKWMFCTDDPSGEGVSVESIQDLNGDGRAEAVVTEGGTFCYGNTGAAFALVSQQADGSWKKLAGETGMATFLKARSLGWPDLEVGGPGFCFPVSRWNGREYAFHHFNEYMKGMCARNGLKPAVRAY